MSEEDKNILRADYRSLMEELEHELRERKRLLDKAEREYEQAFTFETEKRRNYWRGRVLKTEKNIEGLKRLGAALGGVLTTHHPAVQNTLF